MPPHSVHGKICYVQIPATDIDRSAAFYQQVFGWNIRHRDDGAVAFDDGLGEVSGQWVTGRPPAAEPGLLFYIMVDDAQQSVAAVTAAGGGSSSGSGSASAPAGRGVRGGPEGTVA